MTNPNRLPLWAIAAGLGGSVWAVKGLSILVTGDQPRYVFELAPLCFAVATIGLVRLLNAPGRTGVILAGVAWTGVLAGTVVVIAYLLNGEDGAVFSVAILTTTLVVLGLLLYAGKAINRERRLGSGSVIPFALGWLMIAAIPIGGALEGINERLLEAPLLAVGLGWIALAVAGISQSLARPSTSQPTA